MKKPAKSNKQAKRDLTKLHSVWVGPKPKDKMTARARFYWDGSQISIETRRIKKKYYDRLKQGKGVVDMPSSEIHYKDSSKAQPKFRRLADERYFMRRRFAIGDEGYKATTLEKMLKELKQKGRKEKGNWIELTANRKEYLKRQIRKIKDELNVPEKLLFVPEEKV